MDRNNYKSLWDEQDFMTEQMWLYLSQRLKKKPKFTPKLTLHCFKCGDKINSSYEGEMVWCTCGSCAIDETTHYHRVTGYEGEFELITKDCGELK